MLDGPSANIVALSGVSVARDGTGGVAYLKDVGGVQHVFVSRLAGSFQPPVRVDTGLSGASSQPVIAAGNGGLLLTAFINGGQLFVVDQASTTSGFTTPSVLASGASNPAIAITNLSKAYLAFTANDGSGHDVRGAYYYQGNWEVEPGSFNVTSADDAGTGTGRPAVAAAGDGVGIVVWGEGGHIYTRRVWGVPPSGTGPSIAYEQADIPSLDGWNEVSTSDPVIGSGGDSSYVSVAFNEVLANGSQQQSRVLMRRLRGGMYDVLAQPDGLSTPGVEGADDPGLAAGEYGEGFVTSSREASHELVEMRLGNNGAPGGSSQLDSLPNTAAPFAAPAPAGLHSDLIAWQESPAADSPQIRARFFDGTSFGPEQVLSSPAMGPTDAADGLLADGDGAADAVAVWVQGSAGSRAIVAAQLYQPPGSFGALKRSRYARSVEPTLTWSASREQWGPLRYVVTLDGIQVGQTTGTSLRAAHPAAPGTADPGTPHMAGDGDQPGGRGAERQHRHGVRRHDRAQRPRQADREADAGLPDPHPDPRLGRRRNPSGRGFRDQVGPGALGRRHHHPRPGWQQVPRVPEGRPLPHHCDRHRPGRQYDNSRGEHQDQGAPEAKEAQAWPSLRCGAGSSARAARVPSPPRCARR